MRFDCVTNKNALMYKCFEKTEFTLTYPAHCEKIKWSVNRDGDSAEEGTAEGNVCKITTSLSVPGFAYIHAEALDGDGNPYPDSVPFDGGAGAEVGKIKSSTPVPGDIEDFWGGVLSCLDAVKPEILEMKRVEEPEYEGYDVYDMKIACPGGMPVSGMLSVPRNGLALPVRVGYKGYGVGTAPVETDEKEIIFFINAHGIENRREQSYYDALSDGRLKRYGMATDENARPETSYFYGMSMRAIQAVRFAHTLKRSNGVIRVWGGSQGAFQALTAAVNCPYVNYAKIFVPWMCDINAKAASRYRIASPAYADGLAYYDLCTQAARLKRGVADGFVLAPIEAGLGDESCQSSGIAAMYNALTCDKALYFLQGRTHLTVPENAERFDFPG